MKRRSYCGTIGWYKKSFNRIGIDREFIKPIFPLTLHLKRIIYQYSPSFSHVCWILPLKSTQFHIFFISISVPSTSETLVSPKIALISIAVQEKVFPLAPHRVIFELSFISFSVGEAVTSVTFLHAHVKISTIKVANCAKLLADSMRKTIFKGSLIHAPIFKTEFHNEIFFGLWGLLWPILLFLQFEWSVRCWMVPWEMRASIIVDKFYHLKRLIFRLIDQYFMKLVLLELETALEEGLVAHFSLLDLA